MVHENLDVKYDTGILYVSRIKDNYVYSLVLNIT